jgi:hypothetical protein
MSFPGEVEDGKRLARGIPFSGAGSLRVQRTDARVSTAKNPES